MTHQKATARAGIFVCLVLICGCAAKLDRAGVVKSDFGGVWVGKMIQPNGPRGQDGYNQFLRLRIHRSSAEGIARIEIPDTDFFAEMKFSGTVRNDSLFFSEDSIVNQQARVGHWWCLKRGVLILNRNTMRLAGEWQSQDCAPGRIELHRVFGQWGRSSPRHLE